MAGASTKSGVFLLTDSQRRVRGRYDGTKAKEVDQLMRDMDLLLKEENSLEEK